MWTKRTPGHARCAAPSQEGKISGSAEILAGARRSSDHYAARDHDASRIHCACDRSGRTRGARVVSGAATVAAASTP